MSGAWHRIIAGLALGTCVGGCGSKPLRGNEHDSSDGRTYFAIDDDVCDRYWVDGRPWTTPPRAAAPIAPGVHRISCDELPDSAIAFEVRPGTTFRFDYWGP